MAFSLFGGKAGKPRQAIGLDIGAHSVKVVAVGGTADRLSLLFTSVAPLKRVSEDPIPVSHVRQVVSESLGRIGLEITDLRVSVSGKGVIVRRTEMPRMNPDELRSSIRYEADVLLPFSLDESVFDCHILDPAESNRARMKVVLAAARKSVIHERLEFLKALELVPKVISVDSVAIANAFAAAMRTEAPPIEPAPAASPGEAGQAAEPSPEDTVAVVHVGAARTVLNIMSAEGLELTRDIDVGGASATVAIARGLGIDYPEAERRKEADDPAVREFTAPMAMMLSRELHSTFGYLATKMQKAVGKVYVSGGGALCPPLVEKLAADLGLAVRGWDPLRGIHSVGGMAAEAAKGREPLLAVAAGLALAD